MANVQKIDISSSTIFRTILILVAFWFLYIIRDLLVVLIGAIIVAAAIEPVANRLQRYRMPRAVSVILVYVAFLGLLGIAVTLIFPILAEQTLQLAQAVPAMIQEVEGFIGSRLPISSETLSEQAQAGLNNVGNSLANATFNVFQQTRSIFSGLVSVVFVFVIALYLVIEESALIKFFRIIVPAEHRQYVTHALDRIHYKIGRWVLGQLTLAIIIGVVVSIGLWLLGVEYALALGLLAGLFEIIPVIGPILAGVAGVVVALSQSWLLGLGVFIFYVLVQQAENHILIPNVMSRATGLNPLVTLLAVLLGARLAGVAGVILSVPVATMISIFLSDIFDHQEEGLPIKPH